MDDKPEEHAEMEIFEDDIEQLQYKFILLGDGAVGKTSIAMRFGKNEFQQTYKQTIGCDFHSRRLDLPPRHKITVQLWDIGGQSIGSRMISKYIVGAHAVLLCYDITNYESFANLEGWYRIVKSVLTEETMPLVALIGNKSEF